MRMKTSSGSADNGSVAENGPVAATSVMLLFISVDNNTNRSGRGRRVAILPLYFFWTQRSVSLSPVSSYEPRRRTSWSTTHRGRAQLRFA